MIAGERRVFAPALVVPGLAPEDNIFIKSALGAQFTTQPPWWSAWSKARWPGSEALMGFGELLWPLYKQNHLSLELLWAAFVIQFASAASL